MKKINVVLFLVIFSFLFIVCKKDEIKNENKVNNVEESVIYDLAFEKDGMIFVANFQKNILDSLFEGFNPALSPDGHYLAFTDYNGGKRHVTIYDFNTKKRIPINIPNDNNYGPIWSPDGKLIAFNIFYNNNWYIAVANKENTTVRIITDKIKRGTYSPSWFSDSKKLLVHDLDYIYLVDLDGNILKKYFVNDIAKDLLVSSQTRFIMSSDEKKLFFSAGVDEDSDDFDEPPEAIFYYDFNLKKLNRLSPKGLYCAEIILKNDSMLYFYAAKDNEEPFSIYSINIFEKKPILLVKNGSSLSVNINR